MEKLIELLNKFEAKLEEMPLSRERWREENGILYRKFMSVEDAERMVISKSFGFIEWLVQNDKIDFDKCGLDVRYYLSYNKRYDKGIVMAENYDNDTFVVKEFYSPYEQLLMLLSISDNPIDLLCERLK